MPSITQERVGWEAERGELQAVTQSHLFARSPALVHLLSYLCEKTFAGETEQIKEYSIALEVFDRRESFDQDADSIVRVQANRLRKRLREYYEAEGAAHALRIAIPVGQYIPVFEKAASSESNASTPQTGGKDGDVQAGWRMSRLQIGVLVSAAMVLVVIMALLAREKPKPQTATRPSTSEPAVPAAMVGLPVGEELRLLAGASRKYVDHAGKIWGPDAYFSGGTAVPSSIQHIWRTQDPIVYRSSRQGDFTYNIPLKPGTYELRLHFAETFYGPENAGDGGEGSRIMTVTANGRPLLQDFDVLADSGGDRTAEVKVFPDVAPAADGLLHLGFASAKGGSAMVSAIEILPGARGKIRPVRILARDVPYYSNDSQWWSPDIYFKGGQLSSSQEPALGTDDPEFYETERWGHFSYAIPVAPGRYTATLYFIEHHPADSYDRAAVPVAGAGAGAASQDRVFDVYCNGRTVIEGLDIVKQVGEHRPLVRKIKGLEPNAQGKLLLEFVPVTRYATVTAIEVVAE